MKRRWWIVSAGVLVSCGGAAPPNAQTGTPTSTVSDRGSATTDTAADQAGQDNAGDGESVENPVGKPPEKKPAKPIDQRRVIAATTTYGLARACLLRAGDIAGQLEYELSVNPTWDDPYSARVWTVGNDGPADTAGSCASDPATHALLLLGAKDEWSMDVTSGSGLVSSPLATPGSGSSTLLSRLSCDTRESLRAAAVSELDGLSDADVATLVPMAWNKNSELAVDNCVATFLWDRVLRAAKGTIPDAVVAELAYDSWGSVPEYQLEKSYPDLTVRIEKFLTERSAGEDMRESLFAQPWRANCGRFLPVITRVALATGLSDAEPLLRLAEANVACDDMNAALLDRTLALEPDAALAWQLFVSWDHDVRIYLPPNGLEATPARARALLHHAAAIRPYLVAILVHGYWPGHGWYLGGGGGQYELADPVPNVELFLALTEGVAGSEIGAWPAPLLDELRRQVNDGGTGGGMATALLCRAGDTKTLDAYAEMLRSTSTLSQAAACAVETGDEVAIKSIVADIDSLDGYGLRVLAATTTAACEAGGADACKRLGAIVPSVVAHGLRSFHYAHTDYLRGQYGLDAVLPSILRLIASGKVAATERTVLDAITSKPSYQTTTTLVCDDSPTRYEAAVEALATIGGSETAATIKALYQASCTLGAQDTLLNRVAPALCKAGYKDAVASALKGMKLAAGCK